MPSAASACSTGRRFQLAANKTKQKCRKQIVVSTCASVYVYTFLYIYELTEINTVRNNEKYLYKNK